MANLLIQNSEDEWINFISNVREPEKALDYYSKNYPEYGFKIQKKV